MPRGIDSVTNDRFYYKIIGFYHGSGAEEEKTKLNYPV